jgi:hypothetical protein
VPATVSLETIGGRSGRVKTVAAYGAAWIGLFWTWMAFQGEWDKYEWIAGAAAATLAAALPAMLAHLGVLRFRIPLGVLKTIPQVIVQVPLDFALIIRALLRRPRGRFVVRTFESPKGVAVAAGDRAARLILASYSPNAYALDVDPGSHRVLLHDLVPRRGSEEPA